MARIDARLARDAIARLPDGTGVGESPALGDVYLPRSHLKAMDLDVPVVTGMRGAGKTFWWGALQKGGVRRLVGKSLARVRTAPKEGTEVAIGFGNTPAPGDYPGINELPGLIQTYDPRIVWRTVLARRLARSGDRLRRAAEWPDRIEYVRRNPAAIDRLLSERDDEYDREDRHFLILFDALDRSADSWEDMYRAIRGLLQAAVEMRPYRRLSVKIFLRSDQLDKDRVANFADASKALSSSMDLGWPRRELYGLLWHYLGNGKYGEQFRSFFGGRWERIGSGAEESFQVPRELVIDEDRQRDTFHELSGTFMGTGHRRGFPYTWVPNHLGDAHAHVTPRAFLVALRNAAEATSEEFSDHEHALHFNGIKSGVRKASTARVDEIREDYPWINSVLRPLEGMTVPCRFDEIAERWRAEGALQILSRDMEREDIKLPPRHVDDGPRGVREDLESMGIFQRLLDGRVNMPDIFRVGYGLGRKGGVRSVR